MKKFNLIKARFHPQQKNVIIIQGYYRDTDIKTSQIKLYLDGEPLTDTTSHCEDTVSERIYLIYDIGLRKEILFFVTLPSDYLKKKYLDVICFSGYEKEHSCRIAIRPLCKKRNDIECWIKSITIENSNCIIKGQLYSVHVPQFQIEDQHKKNIRIQIEQYSDKIIHLPKEITEFSNFGFQVTFPINKGDSYQLLIFDGKRIKKYKVPITQVNVNNKLQLGKRMGATLGKGCEYLLTHNVTQLMDEMRLYIQRRYLPAIDYDTFRRRQRTSAAALKWQEKVKFEQMPLFSFLIVNKPKNKLFLDTISSIENQSYRRWEICYFDANRHNAKTILDNLRGDFMIFLEPFALLSSDALYEVVRLYNDKPDLEMIYTDEDKVSVDGKKYFAPLFKPDFNLDLLRSMNYIGAFAMIKKSLFKRVSVNERETVDWLTMNSYGRILRCIEATNEIGHVPRIVFHSRVNKKRSRAAAKQDYRELLAHYQRCGILAQVMLTKYPGIFRTKYLWEDKPLISIIIPNKDHRRDLAKCIAAIESRSTYRNYEYIIVENNSVEPATFSYYQTLQKENKKVRVVYYQGGFNYSKINNYGATYAQGDYLLLLNNDTEMIRSDCLWELLSVCMRPDVGVVGAKLYYADQTIQHAGAIIGILGVVGHAFLNNQKSDHGYAHRAVVMQDLSAVTAACMMTKKEVFTQVGGLSEQFQVAFNDIDYCLKIRALGKLVVFNPYAELYHYESKSRGSEDSPAKVERFHWEITTFVNRWSAILLAGDPYYNPNLTLWKADFSLKGNP
jgi:GT2 family glycosyltransferase